MPSAAGAARDRAVVILSLCCSLCGSGCASLVHKAPAPGRGTTMQEVHVSSEPAGAQVVLNGRVLGVTPTRVRLVRKNPNQVLRLLKDGYLPRDVPLKRRVSGAVAGNLPFALLALNPLSGQNGLADNPWSRSEQAAWALTLPAIGVGVDFLTGAAYTLPSRIHVTLEARR